MLSTYLNEALGMFVFVAIIMFTGNLYLIPIALLIGIVIAQMGSQGHLNPCVTAVKWLDLKVDNTEAMYYIVAQLVGAVCAYYWVKNTQLNNFSS